MAQQSIGRNSDKQGGYARRKEIEAAAAVRFAVMEALEARSLFNVTLSVGENINVTRMLENQSEETVVVNPTNPNQLFIATNYDAQITDVLDGFPDADVLAPSDSVQAGSPSGPAAAEPDGGLEGEEEESGVNLGMVAASSNDGGRTWTTHIVGQDDGLPFSNGDPTAAYDSFGNLYMAYVGDLSQPIATVSVAVSTDNGATFTLLKTFSSPQIIDQPTLITGPGSVWITFEYENQQRVSGAAVTGLGAVGTFSDLQTVPEVSSFSNFGDLTVGPNGQLLVAYQPAGLGTDAAVPLFVTTDPDGLGPQPFGPPVEVASTRVGIIDSIGPQAERGVVASVGVAYDRSGGPFNGRAYFLYNDQPQSDRNFDLDTAAGGESNSDLDVFIRYSDDDGKTWSAPIRVNDSPVGTTQYLPRMAIDQTTGNVGVDWHDTRNEVGLTPGIPNDEVQFWATAGVPTSQGVVFAPSVQISAGTSLPRQALSVTEVGDYVGIDFRDGVLYAAWADNSNSTGDNPSGGVDSTFNLATFDVYFAKVTVTPVAAPTVLPVLPSSPLGPDFAGKSTVTGGKSYTFKVSYKSDSPIDLSSIGGDDLLIEGPGGFSASPQLVKVKADKTGTAAQATYRISDDDGKFDREDNGQYTVFLRAASVRDTANRTNEGGILDRFIVSSKAKPKAVRVAANRQAAQAIAHKALAPLFAENRVSASDLLDKKD